MALWEFMRSGFWLTLNVASTIALFYISITLFRGEYWFLTLDTLAQLLTTTVYQSGFNTHFGVPKLRRSALDVPNGQLNKSDSRNGAVSSVPRSQQDTNEAPYGAIPRSPSSKNNSQVVASVVGWREDPYWYTQCLNSLAENWNCDVLIAGIDGNEPQDEQMFDVFRTVCPKGLVIRLQKTLSQVMKDIISSQNLAIFTDADAQRIAMEELQKYVRSRYRLLEVLRPSVHHTRAICLVQPHGSKKDILFTSMVFAIVVAKDIDTQVIFSTDSDTIVYPDALQNLARRINSDSRIGGVSGHMRFFHARPTYVSRLAAAYYWYQQDIAKIQGSVSGFNECQPGPCAGFRAAALESVLVSWVVQEVCGQKMISNEDRHFTTQILASGYSVIHEPNAVVETDTPNSFRKWIRQQIRWMRGTMIETAAYPSMLYRLSPWAIYSLAKTRFLPLVTFWAVISTVIKGRPPEWLGLSFHLYKDCVLSVALQIGYLILCKPNGVGARRVDLLWVLPSLLWFLLWFPPIVVWSLSTVLDGSWGTPMRATIRAKAEGGALEDSVVSGLRKRAVPKDMAFMFIWLALVTVSLLTLVGIDLATCLGIVSTVVLE